MTTTSAAPVPTTTISTCGGGRLLLVGSRIAYGDAGQGGWALLDAAAESAVRDTAQDATDVAHYHWDWSEAKDEDRQYAQTARLIADARLELARLRTT